MARGIGRPARRVLVMWALLFGLWLLLVGSLAPSELVAGVAAAAVAATAVEVVRRQHVVRFHPNARWLLRLRGVPWRTLKDFGLLTSAVFRATVGRRRVVGRFVAVDFDVGGRDSRSVARRAMVTAGASIAPNSYVVDFDPDGDRMIVHQLVPPYAKRFEDVVP